MSRIFISYKRVDKDKVFKIRDQIESALGEKCWIDLDGIESDAQFKNVIIKAINECEIVLFMYSKAHSKIVDFEKDWTVRELNFAQKRGKRIVFVNLDRSVLSDIFEFDYGTKQQVDGLSEESLNHLCEDLSKWIGLESKNNEEEKQRHDKIEKYESEMFNLDAQLIAHKKNILIKEQELRLAQVDYDECVKKIQKLKNKIEELRQLGKDSHINISKGEQKVALSTNAEKHVVNIFQKIENTSQRVMPPLHKFQSKADVFQYVKANSLYPKSLANNFEIRSSLDWREFALKLNKEYGIKIDKNKVVDIKGLVNSIWAASRHLPPY